jgi:sulfide:quinone oxidoreductase
MTVPGGTDQPFRVLIAGGGVAGLEAALTIGELAGDRVQMTLLAPNDEFVYRPMAVTEPFARAGAAHYPMAPIVAEAGAEHVVDSLKWLDHSAHNVHTDGGRVLPYDALLLALGVHRYDHFHHVTTIDPDDLDGQLHGLIQDVELGLVRRLAFVIPPGQSWPLPIYELALMTAARAYEMGQTVDLTIVIPDHAPLLMFGAAASAAVGELLSQHGITVVADANTRVSAPGHLTVGVANHPWAGDRTGELTFDRIIALPELRGMGVSGLPARTVRGFVAVDAHGRVRGIPDVFAAGDMTDYPVKHGALAAQQAAAVAQEIAGLSGLATTAAPCEPVLHGVLLGGRTPLYLRSRLVGGRPASSEVSTEPLWSPADKVHAPHLTQALSGLGSSQPAGLALAGKVTSGS